MIMLLSDVENFFQDHPLKEEFFGHSESERSGTFAVALRDVRAALGGYVPTAEELEFFHAAVAEQTVFLLLNPEYLTGAYTRTSSVSAAGENRKFSGQDSPLGQRAAALIAPLLGKSISGYGTSGGSSENDSTASILRLVRG